MDNRKKSKHSKAIRKHLLCQVSQLSFCPATAKKRLPY